MLSLLLLAAACSDDSPGASTAEPSSDTDASTGSGASDTSLDEPGSSGTTGDPEPGWAEICDGSEGLRLAMVLGGGGQVANELERELGFGYLYVLGTCEYLALPADAGMPWPDARRGILGAEAEEQLSLALGYGGLADVAGAWGSDGAADGTTLLVSDGVHAVACTAGCDDGPEAARVLWAELPWIDALWAEGEPLDGPLRISVVGWANASLDELGVPWPLEADPWSLAVDGDTEPPPQAGQSILVDDPQQVALLRELRRQYREGDLPEGLPNALEAYGHLAFTDAGGQDLFQLWMRDALPIEDDAGLVPLPSP